jgi:hypothetical protein
MDVGVCDPVQGTCMMRNMEIHNSLAGGSTTASWADVHDILGMPSPGCLL